MPIGNVAAGENDVGDKAMAMGENPAVANLHEGLESGRREDGAEIG